MADIKGEYRFSALGVIIDAIHILEHYRIGQMLDSHSKLINVLVDPDSGIVEGTATEIERAQVSVDRELSAPLNSALVDHYLELGGELPQSL